MAVGPALSKTIMDNFIQNQAQWLLGVWQTAQRMHQEAAQLPTDAPTLTGLGYAAGDVNNIIAIIYQLDRVQTLLSGTIPGSASSILADAALVLQPGQ